MEYHVKEGKKSHSTNTEEQSTFHLYIKGRFVLSYTKKYFFFFFWHVNILPKLMQLKTTKHHWKVETLCRWCSWNIDQPIEWEWGGAVCLASQWQDRGVSKQPIWKGDYLMSFIKCCCWCRSYTSSSWGCISYYWLTGLCYYYWTAQCWFWRL